MNVPKIRFKPDVGGAYPEWVSKPLKEVCKKIKDGTHFSPKSKSGPRKYITSKNIRNSGLDLSNCSYISEDEHREIYRRCSADLGDVLLTKDGAGTGNCCLNTLAEEFSLLSSVAVLSGEAGILSNEFLLQILQSKLGQNAISNVIAGQAITRITLDKINKFTFMLPNYEEQKKIASFLAIVDRKISNLTKKHELLMQYKNGVMQKIFNQEIRFKDKGGKNFSEWRNVHLGDIAYSTTGSSNRIDSSLIGQYTFFDRSEDIRTSDKFLFDCEAIIVGGEGQAFIPKYFVGKFDLHQRAYAIKDFRDCMGKYIYYHIDHYRNYFLSKAVGSTVKSLRLPMFNEMPIKLPVVEEQQKISVFLTELDIKISNLNQQLELTEQYKQGLLQQMFI